MQRRPACGGTPGAVLHWKVASLRSGLVLGFSACVQPLLHAASAVGFIEVPPIDSNGRIDIAMPENLAERQVIFRMVLKPRHRKNISKEMGINSAPSEGPYPVLPRPVGRPSQKPLVEYKGSSTKRPVGRRPGGWWRRWSIMPGTYSHA